MSETVETEAQEATTSQAQEAETAEAQTAEATTTATAQEATAETSEEKKTFDADYVKKLRTEAAEARNRAKNAEAKVKEFEDAKLSDQEKAQKRAEEAEQKATASESRLKEANLKVAVTDLAADPEIGLKRVSAALKLIDRDAITYDDDGEPDTDSVKRALQTVLTEVPELKGKVQVDPPDPANPESRKKTPESQAEALQRIQSGGSGIDIFEGANIVLTPRSGVQPE